MLEMKQVRFFIAGIMQGSHHDSQIHGQSYRQLIYSALKHQFPESHIYCPFENHPDSVNYSDLQARDTFIHHIDLVKGSDCLIVYLPSASLGSAVEMWEAYLNKTHIVTISPMKDNWVIRIVSDVVVENLDQFRAFVSSGGLNKLLGSRFTP